MPKKKGQKKKIDSGQYGLWLLLTILLIVIVEIVTDFTINDCANALKPVGRVKKSVVPEVIPEKTWEDLNDDELDLMEETNSDGTKNIVYHNKSHHSRVKKMYIDDQVRIVYPEIVWYLISSYIKPEDVGNFAGINKSTYAVTKRESFWRLLYMRYCKNSSKLPDKLRIENSYKVYGLKQRVIRALYSTYDVFIKKVILQSIHDPRPHQLVKRRCVNVWYCKGTTHWSVFFKLKKCSNERLPKVDVIDELGRIDANPEEETQVLQVTCQSCYEVPPLMGMILTSVRVVLSQEFRHHRLHLGFNTGHYSVQKIVPERSVVIDTVVNMSIYDWWHPKYPHFDESLPSFMKDEESLPVLKTDFFTGNINI